MLALRPSLALIYPLFITPEGSSAKQRQAINLPGEGGISPIGIIATIFHPPTCLVATLMEEEEKPEEMNEFCMIPTCSVMHFVYSSKIKEKSDDLSDRLENNCS